MDQTWWHRLNELYQAAIARPAGERPAFLAEACAGDEEMECQVHRLVRAHERSGGFLERPALTDGLRILASRDASSAVDPLLSSVRAGTGFHGTGRFVVRRQLGAGGMGVVYEVFDEVRRERVALKTLRRARAADIYRLKREFRSLADIAHPNLVSLYELVVADADCFFTMELVPGVNLLQYLRGRAGAPARVDYEQFRRVLRQLVEGIAAVHRHGKLHRDIKPSNILVTPAERVVILDFGLASDLVPEASFIGESLAGTPAYLAPERHGRAAPSESQDWYSVGVTLYELLTGHVPFDGPFEEMGRRKRTSDPPSPAQLAGDVPQDLDTICVGLLNRDPARRLSGAEVARMLEPESASPGVRQWTESDIEPVFVGRRRHLDALEDALRDAKRGSARTVYVHGASGIGKSALVQHFLERASAGGGIIVLRGRCYERESVPYKALDGVIDSLSQHLRGLPRSHVERLLPADVAALVRLFPVMRQPAAATTGGRDAGEHADPLVVRQRAFDALRTLLTRMADQQPVVVFIDDLHWADADSAVLLEELLRPPQAPPILTIACFRAEEIGSKPFLQALLERTAVTAGVGLPLEPMSDEEARALLMSAMGGHAPAGEAVIARFTRDTGGNPFLLRHLAGYVATHGIASNRTTFAQMLDERLQALPPGGREFLEALAICGRAMDPDVVRDAVGLVGDERSLVARLRAVSFLRASGSAQRVELYHDRIRETLAARVSPEGRRTLHEVLARTLVARGVHDPEALYEHHREAGNYGDASSYAALAAQKADATLAFDRAALYYRAALELSGHPEGHLDWRERLAAALAHAGRPAEAADAYLDAAAQASATRRVELQRAAAEQLLIGGHIDRGLDVIRTVLRAVHLRLPRGRRTALASLLWRRLQLRWRGLAFVERDAERVPRATLLRVDTCWSVTTGFAMVDFLHTTGFQTRHLGLALECGDPYRLARALAGEAFYLGSAGGPSRQLALDAAGRAEAMAARSGHPHAVALCALARGAAAFLVGNWPEAQTHSERALGLLQNRYFGLWELNAAQVFRLSALMFQGEIAAVARELPVLLASAHGRGNLYLETELRTRMNLVWLAADRPDEGLEEATKAMRQWSQASFHRLHYSYMLDRIQTELYRGRARAAWQVITEGWASLVRSYWLRVQFQRIEARFLRARCALLMAASASDARRYLAVARADARSIEREAMAWSHPLASLVLAAVAYREGRVDAARDRLTQAAAGFERSHMKLYEAVARRRLGELSADEASQRGRGQADEWMAGQGIVNPSLITRLIAPGCAD